MHGYYQPPPPPRSSGVSALTIVLIVLVVVLVLGGGGCLLCIGLAASVDDSSKPTAPASPIAPAGTNMVRDSVAQNLETKLRQQGVPATSVLCPASRSPAAFQCELTVGSDRATIQVRDTGAGFSFDVPDTAFLDGAKLTSVFQTTIASKVDPKLRVPCFTGTLMKKVGSQFSCEVVTGAVPAGTVVVTVDDAKGGVHMDYTGTRTPSAAPAPKPAPVAPAAGPRVVDFVCPAGQAPGGAVRAGCLCGSDILGSACGPGGFTDVTGTPRGCRFVCQ